MSDPVLSIITVCFRDRDNLAETFASIRQVKTPKVEYVVIDGGSDDGTIELSKQNEDIIDFFISEPDKGTFNAMNKGIRASKGKWVLFINAGDKIADPIRFCTIDLGTFCDAGLVYGNTVYANVGERKPFPELSLRYGLIMACHNSMFFNREVLGESIFYNEQFRLISDYDLVCRIVRKGIQRQYINVPVAYFLGGGLSSKVSWEARKARYYFVLKHYGIGGVLSTGLESIGLLSLPNRREA